MAKTEHKDLPVPCHSKLFRASSSTYRKACSNPQSMPTGTSPWPNQIHHILCEHAILDIEPKDDDDGKKLKYIRGCLCSITYDINKSDNLIGLPTRAAYRNSNGETPSNLTCHTVDHNTGDGYTRECRTWLHDNLWNTLVAKDQPHETDLKTVADTLEDCTGHFKGLLSERGARGVGTKESWQTRLAIPDSWYEPFSMADVPTPRSPGGKLPEFSIIRLIG